MAVVSYKCPNCGGPLTFNPEKQKFSCDYCLSDFDEQELIDHYKELDENLETAVADESVKDENNRDNNTTNGSESAQDADDNFEQNAVVYTCPSCGAEVMTTDSTAATECYYCHNPVVLGGRLSGKLKPDKIIPFVISREAAIKNFEEMCSKKWFLPHGFFSKKQIEKMTGVYFPYWYHDSEDEVRSTISAKTVDTWQVGRQQYTETKKYELRRNGVTDINNISYGALSKENQMMLNSVHPYDTGDIKDFSMTYLSGFQAEKRDIEMESLRKRAQEDVEEYVRELIKESCSEYSSVHIESISTKNLNKDWRYTLLPVWVITYKFGGKIYPYAMNGQTGKMYGSLPASYKRLALLVGIVAAAIIVIGTIGGMFLL